jgi:hypothetical protein
LEAVSCGAAGERDPELWRAALDIVVGEMLMLWPGRISRTFMNMRAARAIASRACCVSLYVVVVLHLEWGK